MRSVLFHQFLEIQFKLGANANFGIKVDFKNEISEIILHNAENMYIFAIESTNQRIEWTQQLYNQSRLLRSR
jgi:hypothetical protein